MDRPDVLASRCKSRYARPDAVDRLGRFIRPMPRRPRCAPAEDVQCARVFQQCRWFSALGSQVASEHGQREVVPGVVAQPHQVDDRARGVVDPDALAGGGFNVAEPELEGRHVKAQDLYGEEEMWGRCRPRGTATCTRGGSCR